MAGTESAKPKSKSEILAALAESTGLTRKDISKVFDELSMLIGKEIGKKGPGVFTVPGLMKITVAQKPSTKPNPYKPGEMVKVTAKPAKAIPAKKSRQKSATESSVEGSYKPRRSGTVWIDGIKVKILPPAGQGTIPAAKIRRAIIAAQQAKADTQTPVE